MTTATIQMPEKIQLDESTHTPTFGRFIVQPLEKGFGVTIGNSMRRVLLSSLPGYAITAFRVEGVAHEFSSIPGVVEDVPEFVLNLKQVRMKMVNKKTNRVLVPPERTDEFHRRRRFRRPPPDIEILNPGLHIATLNEEADLELDLRIGRGIGYVVAEENKAPDQVLGRHPDRLGVHPDQECPVFRRDDARRTADGLREADDGDRHRRLHYAGRSTGVRG